MTLEEAIKEMKFRQKALNKSDNVAHAKAHQLGIEALERLKKLRDLTNANRLVAWRSELHEQLPSETEGGK